MNKQIPRNIVSILLLFIVLLFSAGTSNAQHYPVQCNVQLIPPYSVHLADYYQGGNQKLLVNLTLKDLNHADLSVRLRISIEGQGIKLITKDDFIPKNPVLLQAGTPELLYGDRLEEYLAPEHMNFSGITQKQFLKTGRLPEGVYKFTVEVFEARRQEKVSNTATSMAWMLLNEPPVITAPANNKLLKATDPASIFFNWLPRHMNSQNALADVEYEFTMVEIWPVNQSAEEAIRSKEPLLKTVFRNTSFVYDAQYPMLVPGRQYACRVRAFSNQQKEMFKNEGYSPVVSFVFGEECKPPLMVDVDPALGGSAQLSIVPQSNHSSFTVQIRDVAGDKWYSQQSNQPDFELKQLKPGAAYQYKVQAQCGTLESEFTPISQFSLSKEQAEVECGQSAAIPEIDGSPALNQLTAGDVINAGGFKVTVKQASGSRGTFTGSGVVRIGMLGNIELRTVFDNIKINESYQLTAGEIRVVGSDIYALGSDVRDQADDFFNNDIWDSVDDAIADAESIVDEISNLQTDMGDNSLNNELEKAKRTIEKGRDQLAVGNQKGAQLVKEGADKVAQILDQVNSGDFQITANGIFFFAHSSQSYGFDSHDEGLTEEEKKAYLPYYQSLQLGDTTKQYYLKAWKSIGSNGNDVVNVKMQLSNGMKADTVHFMNAMGAEITPQKQGNAFSLNLRGSFHEDVQQITAYYNVKDDSTKKTKKVPLGALNVISYDQIEKNLVLVPVNMQAGAINTQALAKYLNETYKVANVSWSVDHALRYLNVDWLQEKNNTLSVSGLSSFSNYTNEMNKLIRALKKVDDYNKDDRYSYMFLIKSSDDKKIKALMPKNRSWGFVFTDALDNYDDDFCRTVAHELGHGCFRLTHNFDDFANVQKGTTQNLMDYRTGNELRRYQWNDIHNLRSVKLWGQNEEGNASMVNCTLEKVKEYFLQRESYTKLVARRKTYDHIFANFDDLMKKLEVNAKKEDYKAEVENIEGWSLRASTLSENEKGFLYERILKKMEESENDKEVTFNLNEKGIYLGKAKIDDQNYNLAIYTDKEKSSITKAQLKDYCELIDNEEINKQIKVAEIGDYLLLAFFKDEKVEMVIQFMSDDDDEFKKLLTAFKVLKGEEKFEGKSKAKVPISIETFKDIEYFKDIDEKVLEKIISVVNTYSNKDSITTPKRMANFLAQISVESDKFSSLTEHKNYSVVGAVRFFAWKKYAHAYEGYTSDLSDCRGVTYEDDGSTRGEGSPMPATPDFLYSSKQEIIDAYSDGFKVKDKKGEDVEVTGFTYDNIYDKMKSNRDYNSGLLILKSEYYGKNNTMVADLKYSCRNGNRAPNTGDGSRYMGAGFIQITGRYNYNEVYKKWKDVDKSRSGISIEEFMVKLTTDIETAMEASMIFWNTPKSINGKNVTGNSLSEDSTVEAITKFVNGGTMHKKLRENNYNELIKKIK